MKKLLTALCFGTLMSTSAYADNVAVETALVRNPELRTFYQALINTGVNHELEPNRTYTIFAPTNEAFRAVSPSSYPCFYSAECRAEVAQVVRNHIVPGYVFLDDAITRRGGLYSIGHRFVTIGEPSQDLYAISGNNVVDSTKMHPGMLYVIDGVIANPRELSAFRYAPVTNTLALQPFHRTIPDPSCGSAGCPDASREVITLSSSTESNSPY